MSRDIAVAIVTGLILDRPTCVTCIATKGGLSIETTKAVLSRIASVVESHRTPDRCRVCGETKPVFSVERPRP